MAGNAPRRNIDEQLLIGRERQRALRRDQLKDAPTTFAVPDIQYKFRSLSVLARALLLVAIFLTYHSEDDLAPLPGCNYAVDIGEGAKPLPDLLLRATERVLEDSDNKELRKFVRDHIIIGGNGHAALTELREVGFIVTKAPIKDLEWKKAHRIKLAGMPQERWDIVGELLESRDERDGNAIADLSRELENNLERARKRKGVYRAR